MKRGNLLWTGSRMMLSEHREQINQQLHREQKEYEDLTRDVDEQLLAEWQEIFEEAITKNTAVYLLTKDKKKISGFITGWTHEGEIYVQDKEGQRERVALSEIVDIRLSTPE